MDDLIRLTKKRMAAMVAAEKIGSDAITKSLRCYETMVHPLFKERLSIWYDWLDKRSVSEGKTFIYDESVAGMTGSRLMNYVFQSFYDQEPGEEVDIIYPRISRKTAVLYTNSSTSDMFSEVVGWLEESSARHGLEMIGLRKLAEEELGATTVQDLLDNTLNSSLSQGISELLLSNDFHFPANEFVTVRNRVRNQDLLMKVKYYPARDDNRAYCSDHSRLRSLVASLLNRMISPKSKHLRQKLHSATILRPDKKDMLDLHLPQTDREELYTYLILLDVSNFTGSLANAWLMIYTMGLEVAVGKLKDRCQIFSIGGQFLQASWKELLLLYVYLTVGVPCWVEDQKRYGYLSGGFLGIGGNMTIGLLCLAVILQYTLNQLKPRVFDIRAQAGGDDTGFLIRCIKDDIGGVVDDIREQMEAYVGKLKELSVYCIEDLDDGVIEDALFCRKRVILTRDYNGIHLTGEPSVPLPESLFPDTTQNRLDLQIKAWRELDYNLQGFEAVMPNMNVLTDTLRQLFLEKYRKVQPVRSYQTRRLTSSHRVLRYGNTLITDVAHREALTIHSIEHDGVVALSNYESKVRHALITEVVSMIKVDLEENESALIIMTKKEVNLLEQTRWKERLHLEFSEDLLEELTKVVEK